MHNKRTNALTCHDLAPQHRQCTHCRTDSDQATYANAAPAAALASLVPLCSYTLILLPYPPNTCTHSNPQEQHTPLTASHLLSSWSASSS
jgi:hypothetical protein